MDSENIKNYHDMIDDIANHTHEKFRKIYRELSNGTRIKTTKDATWIKRYGTDQADLAKLNYYELPSDWKNERKSGSKVALDSLLEAVKKKEVLDENFVENTSIIIHNDWLERNINIAKNEHRLTYDQLSEEAKEKDRIFAYSAIEIYKRRK